MTSIKRVSDGAELGLHNRWADIALGSGAIIPLVGAALDVWISATSASEVGSLAALWSGGLTMFFGGVRRGLTFSEKDGGRSFELATMVWLFCIGMAAILLMSLPLAILGLFSVGALDFWAARAHETPLYFRVFRPLQMGLACLSLAAVLIRTLTGSVS